MENDWYAGQYVDVLKKNIYVLDGFISDIQSDHLRKICQMLSRTSNQSTGWISDSGLVESMSIVGISIWDDIQNRLNKTISAYAGRRLLVHSTPYARIYKSGSSKSLHADGEGATDSGQPIVMDGYKQDYESCSMLVEYASNIYLNNDFSGGDLYFPYLDVTIKPQKNQLIFFPSGIEFSHQVNEITDGERFAVSTFYTTEKLVSLHALT